MARCETGYQTVHFVDPTIPGLSGRDLITKPVAAIQTDGTAPAACAAARRRDYHIRKALAGLDGRLLRDIGLDRNAS